MRLNEEIEKLSNVEGSFYDILQKAKLVIWEVIRRGEGSTDNTVIEYCNELHDIYNTISQQPDSLENNISRVVYLAKSVSCRLEGLISL